MQTALLLLSAYLIGSIPFGLLIARFVKGIDIRTVGSRNIGATNVARCLGKGWGALVLALDAAKGMLPTWWLSRAFSAGSTLPASDLAIGCGMAAILGHMFPCWLGFRGGKGVATALGVIVVIAPLASVIALGAFGLTFLVSRYVSLSSIVASLCFAVAQLIALLPQPFAPDTRTLALFALSAPLLIIVRHRSNIARLWRGEESQLRSGSDVPPPRSDNGA